MFHLKGRYGLRSLLVVVTIICAYLGGRIPCESELRKVREELNVMDRKVHEQSVELRRMNVLFDHIRGIERAMEADLIESDQRRERAINIDNR